ncbi:glutamate--tRNA ligase [Pseudoflavitalea sp. G-6-1-2]|uniref:glutamate--tRNA ligase n=1 Tax=Pseudoflavitalea sp. G-6-1-2 TaxID=2728841 RepID=UPI00146BB059|nr:glutamate--tRNA ligase [Pseudoflavitalea sp. G-6-1-2]NML19420.1 glutamate--tRNA ligase [Pseudoflavitalea sp. G-6-1-2]
MNKNVRVRFAPSPTGGLHLGGVRTVLYNYLFARHNAGEFVLRIEDTDQTRFVPGAEDYIVQCLQWCGMIPDEGPVTGGPYAPYRQSERKSLYRQYAEQLVKSGHAYYAFDRPEELESMRERFKTATNPAPQYDHNVRLEMRNSCSLTLEETETLLEDGVPHVIRIRMPENETVTFNDMIRGEVSFNTGLVDDKVLLKADGMPTYHLAVVVDDYLMKITHAFRGEEWLPSSPVHVLLWKYLGWEDAMPQWAHLPLILKPDGNGKLSKRDGDRLGFPVFAMNWTDPKTTELTKGFRELGFMPEAFINMLAMLGWNDGTDQEIFTIEELISKFSIDRVHKGGAKFDFEKAKWFNHEWIKRSDAARLLPDVKRVLADNGLNIADDALLSSVITLVKDRCTLLTDFYDQSKFFFETPQQLDLDAVRPKWNAEKKTFFEAAIAQIEAAPAFQATEQEAAFKELAAKHNIKPGELMMPLRIMLVGGKFGPGVFDIAAIIGKNETIHRIQQALKQLDLA